MWLTIEVVGFVTDFFSRVFFFQAERIVILRLGFYADESDGIGLNRVVNNVLGVGACCCWSSRD